MKTEDMIRELRNVAEKYDNDFVATGETNISLMCSEVADRLEALYRENIGLRGDNYEYKKQKFWLEVYGSTTDDLILETEIEFNSREEAENWVDEHFNYDCYAYVTDIVEQDITYSIDVFRDKGYSPEDIIYMFTVALNTEIHIRIMEEKFEKE